MSRVVLCLVAVVGVGWGFLGCDYWESPFHDPTPTYVPTISQGLYGRVVLFEGNCEPPATKRSCKVSYPSRKIFIREAATMDQVSGTYLAGPLGLITTTTPDGDGFYEVSLLPGTYSVFVEDGGREYCNFFGGQREACQVMVGEGLTELRLPVDHAAW